jgi:hypothetical protein
MKIDISETNKKISRIIIEFENEQDSQEELLFDNSSDGVELLEIPDEMTNLEF